jgi:hypothetical protein
VRRWTRQTSLISSHLVHLLGVGNVRRSSDLRSTVVRTRERWAAMSEHRHLSKFKPKSIEAKPCRGRRTGGTASAEVTFGMFSKLAKERGWTREYLIEFCRPWYEQGTRWEEPLSWFVDRLLDPSPLRRWHRTIIPFRALIVLYDRATNPEALAQDDGLPKCRCGCGRTVLGRRKFFNGACRTRAFRRVRDTAKRPQRVAKITASSVTNAPGVYRRTQKGSSALRKRSRGTSSLRRTGAISRPER